MLFSAFIFGLFSSFHCIGMCGPIALMLPVDHQNPFKKTIQIGIYHIGKLLAYMSLGLIFGLLGRGFYLAGMQQQLSILVGLLIIIVALTPEKVFAKYNFSKPIYKIISKVKTSLGQQFRNKNYKSLFFIGLLNGFLPCGMVYMAVFGAIAMQNLSLCLLYMFLFGLGTVPLLTALVYFSKNSSFNFRSNLQKAIPFIAVLIGMLFIIRGLGLNIPYLSPSNSSLFVQQESDCH